MRYVVQVEIKVSLNKEIEATNFNDLMGKLDPANEANSIFRRGTEGVDWYYNDLSIEWLKVSKNERRDWTPGLE